MNFYMYDGSFEGFLTVVFEVYRSREEPVSITAFQNHQPSLTGSNTHVQTDYAHADRVYQSLNRKTEGKAMSLYKAFLSETPEIEMVLYRVVKAILHTGFKSSMFDNYTDPHILKLHQLVKKIHREVHRMHAFVRFQRSESGIYFSTIEPDFNVLPLIGDHFEKRYADQQWMIYDIKRKYGLFYDLKTVSWVTAEHKKEAQVVKEIPAPEEQLYQKLWKTYFDSVNIAERKNVRLHLQHLPRRYWKYLPEKGGM